MHKPKAAWITYSVTVALAEDIGPEDITTAKLPHKHIATATIIAREAGILCGTDWVDEVFNQLSADASTDWYKQDGEQVQANDVLCRIVAPMQALLSGERTALNFLQCFSGTATQTAKFKQAMGDEHKAKLFDTRKTIPGLRAGQKYAVACGGGCNHRQGLFDAYLIKENHIAAAGGLQAACELYRGSLQDKSVPIQQIEVESLVDLEVVLPYRFPLVLLDNFSLADIQRAVSLRDTYSKTNAFTSQLEVSGNVTLDNIRAYAETGVDRISVGALTKNVQALDLSLLLQQSD